LSPIWGPIELALNQVEGKAEVIRDALEENRKLRLENANLRVQAESLRLDCRVQEAQAQSQLNEQILEKETGQKVGRTLASIAYRPPRHLDPAQLHTLGLSYLNAHENEKAAVIFTLLNQMADQAGGAVDGLKNHPLSRVRLLAGVAWYHLDHLELADQYFGEVLDLPETEKDVPFQAQARLWRALAAKRLGKNTKSQFWLREVVDRHPASHESRWVNAAKPSEKTKPSAQGEHHEGGHSDAQRSSH
jgi:tetratricopeptide (TPR) repeat protein